MNKIVYRLVEFTQRHAWLVIAAVAAVTVVLGFFALRMKVDATTGNLIPESAEVKRLTEKYGLANTMHELDTDTRAAFLKEAWAVTIKYISPAILLLILVYFGVYKLFT